VKCDHNRRRRHVDVLDINTFLDETVRKAMAYIKSKKGISEVLIHQTKFIRQVQCNMKSGTNSTHVKYGV
jgi:hypothetical protein